MGVLEPNQVYERQEYTLHIWARASVWLFKSKIIAIQDHILSGKTYS